MFSWEFVIVSSNVFVALKQDTLTPFLYTVSWIFKSTLLNKYFYTDICLQPAYAEGSIFESLAQEVSLQQVKNKFFSIYLTQPEWNVSLR